MSTNPGSKSQKPDVNNYPHHPKYYLEGADLHIIVDDILFRVHSYFFIRESKIFHKRVHPAAPGATRKGASDQDPIKLNNVAPEDFEKFLWVFYNPQYSIYEASVEHWKVVLKLAQLWEFKEVKELAVRELHKKEELNTFERLALYQEHKVDPRHLIPLYSILCERDTPLNVEESITLGTEMTVLIARMREQLRSPPTSPDGRSPLPPSLDMLDVYRAFELEFKLGEGSTTQFHVENGFLSPTSATSPKGGGGRNAYVRGGGQRNNNFGR